MPLKKRVRTRAAPVRKRGGRAGVSWDSLSWSSVTRPEEDEAEGCDDAAFLGIEELPRGAYERASSASA